MGEGVGDLVRGHVVVGGVALRKGGKKGREGEDRGMANRGMGREREREKQRRRGERGKGTERGRERGRGEKEQMPSTR
jgi:hypothetical protein